MSKFQIIKSLKSPKEGGEDQNGVDTHTGMAPPELFNSTLWTKQCKGYTQRWTELHEKYAKWTPKQVKVKIVLYEDLKSDLR